MVVGAFTIETDVAVIGAGPSGMAAALEAAALGRSVTIVDPLPHPGGSVLVDRVLRRLAAETSQEHLRARWDALIATAAEPFRMRLAEAGITFVSGTASFESARDLAIADSPDLPRLRFRRAVIACGPAEPSGVVALHEAMIGEGAVTLCASDPLHVTAAALLARSGRSVTVSGPLRLPLGLREAMQAALHECSIVLTEDRPDGDFASLTLSRAGVRTEMDDVGQGRIVRGERGRTTEPRVLAAGSAVLGPVDARGAVLDGRSVAAEAAGGGGEPGVLPETALEIIHAPIEAAWFGVCEEDDDVRSVPCEGVTLFTEGDEGLVRGAVAIGPGAAARVRAAGLAAEMGAVVEDARLLLVAAEDV